MSLICGQVRSSNYKPNLDRISFSENEMATEIDDEDKMNNIIIDDSNVPQSSTVRNQDRKSISNSIDDHSRISKIDDTAFETYDFVDNPGAIYYNVDNGRSLYS